MLSRLTLALLCAALVGCNSHAPRGVAPSPSPVPVLGADISALTVMEKAGAVFSDSRGTADALTILRRQGANYFRLRLFVAPDGEGMVTNDLEYTLALARRVKASGAALMLDIHYSDTWADPSKQFKPAAWASLPASALVARVRDYTHSVLARFCAEGLRPDSVQVGNEITNGMLWPEGRAEFGTASELAGWETLGPLLRAGVEGVESGCAGGPVPKVVLHVESTGNIPRSLWFFRNAVRQGVRFDLIGLSYYPEWHGSLADLSSTLNTLAAEFGRPVLVAEVAYPWKHDTHWDGRPGMAFPLTPAGQEAFLHEVRTAVARVPGGLGAGLVYWHPESIQARGVHAWLGGSCALFDDQGRLLPAASVLRSSP
jgi:arabinogalactan endo-1,4-beta-galactosidase